MNASNIIVLFFIGKPPAVTVAIKKEVNQPDQAKKGKITPPKVPAIGAGHPRVAGSDCNNPIASKWFSYEIYKHKSNIIEIMRSSNATPIKMWGDKGYMCCHCEDQYLEAADLKKHTLEDHDDVSKTCFLKNMSMYHYIVKLDITDLQCKICSKSIDTVEELMEHLQSEHKKLIYTDIKNHVIPFKLNTKPLECFICKNVFHKFKLLTIHMNKHYRNYVCDVCDAGFVNISGIRLHKSIHKTGTYNCSKCNMIFDTKAKRNRHVKTKHTKEIRHTCGYCKESFNDYRKKEAHLIAAHGLTQPKLKCQACDKLFDHQKRLAVHVKRDHLMERPHACTVCEKKFFALGELRNHMTKHTGERPYKCEVCMKAYGLAKTLREHMRIHNDDRRFKCEHCGQAFVQKCSWRSHMKSKHGEKV